MTQFITALLYLLILLPLTDNSYLLFPRMNIFSLILSSSLRFCNPHVISQQRAMLPTSQFTAFIAEVVLTR